MSRMSASASGGSSVGHVSSGSSSSALAVSDDHGQHVQHVSSEVDAGSGSAPEGAGWVYGRSLLKVRATRFLSSVLPHTVIPMCNARSTDRLVSTACSQDSVEGRADGTSMADESCEEEAEVESRFSAGRSRELRSRKAKIHRRRQLL